MDSRGRVALLVAGAVGLTAAVVLLRQTQATAPSEDDPLPSIAVAPTTVSQFADASVVPPLRPSQPPGQVGEVEITPGDRTLTASWARSAGDDTPQGATGYEVRWGRPGTLDHRMLVAASEVELRGLANGERYDVEVRSVDAFGQYSGSTAAGGTPQPAGPDPLRPVLTGLYDDFSADNAPDPAHWAVQRAGRSCARLGAGTGDEDDRLVLDLRCGNSETALRARATLQLAAGPELGHVVVVTDGPVPGGEVSITVVPGPVHALGVAAGANPPQPEPGRAVEDAGLPPGAIRAVVTASGARIAAGPGTPRTGAAPPPGEPTSELGAPGVTARWELRLTTAGASLYRDDQLAASADVVPNWQEATVLVGFSASPGDAARLHVDAIGFTGPANQPANVVDVADAIAGETAQPGSPPPGRADPKRELLEKTPNAKYAQLQVLAGPAASCPADDLVADFNGPRLQLGTAVPGGLPPRGPYCPYIAPLTPDIMALLREGRLTTPVIRSANSVGVSVTGVLSVTYPAGTAVERKPATEPPGPPPTGDRHRLAQLSAELLNAAGEKLVAGSPVPKGRAVLAVRLDGLAGQRETGQLGGIAGIEVRLDGRLVAGLPTVADSGAAAGDYRFGLSLADLSAGGHAIELRVLGVESGARPRNLRVDFQVED